MALLKELLNQVAGQITGRTGNAYVMCHMSFLFVSA
jgi:hypothetical protein